MAARCILGAVGPPTFPGNTVEPGRPGGARPAGRAGYEGGLKVRTQESTQKVDAADTDSASMGLALGAAAVAGLGAMAAAADD